MNENSLLVSQSEARNSFAQGPTAWHSGPARTQSLTIPPWYPVGEPRWVLCSYPMWLQRTDWRVRIWVWIPVGPFGAVEECGKDRGNQREQRGLPVIISPQFRLGCGHRWVASSLVSACLCGLRVEASLRRDCCSELCRNASGRWVQKRAGKGFFFHSCPDSISLFCYTT